MYEIYERLLKEKGCKTADVAKETGIKLYFQNGKRVKVLQNLIKYKK
jgi:hypothetical protein